MMKKAKQDDSDELDAAFGAAKHGPDSPPSHNAPQMANQLNIRVERVTLVEIGKSLGRASVWVNGIRIDCGIMIDNHDPDTLWVSYPFRRGQGGTPYQLVTPDPDLDEAIKSAVLFSYHLKQTEIAHKVMGKKFSTVDYK